MEGHDRGYIGLDIISESSDYDFVSKFDEENDDSPYSNLLIDCKHLSEEKFIEMYGMYSLTLLYETWQTDVCNTNCGYFTTTA